MLGTANPRFMSEDCFCCKDLIVSFEYQFYNDSKHPVWQLIQANFGSMILNLYTWKESWSYHIWYFLRNSSTKLATKLKNDNLTVINLSLTLSLTDISLFDDGCFDLGSLFQIFIIASMFGQSSMRRSHAFLFSTQLRLIISKILATIIT